MKNIQIVFACIILSIPLSIESREQKIWAEPKLSPVLAPKDRVRIGVKGQELKQHKYFERYQTLYAMLEYSFFESDVWSVYLNVPYTKKWLTDTETTRRLDNIQMGTRLAFPKNNYTILLGLDAELATGDEKKEGIGSKEIGSAEPYIGWMYQKNWIFFSALRYNAETNKNFKEAENQEFSRTAYLDLSFGYRFSWVDLLFEYRYMHRKDPEFEAISNSTIAPTFNFRFNDSAIVSFSVPYALSKEREFDIGAKLEFTGYY